MEADSNLNVMVVYVVYGLVAVVLTALLARTLFRNGAVFLEDVFEDRPGLAVAVNRLLVVGFYMLNLGYAAFVLRAEPGLPPFEAVQFFVNRLAVLLLALAGLHFGNVLVFWWIRSGKERRRLSPPVAPGIVLQPGTAVPQE